MEGEGEREGGGQRRPAILAAILSPSPAPLAPHVWMWAEEPRLRVLQNPGRQGVPASGPGWKATPAAARAWGNEADSEVQ